MDIKVEKDGIEGQNYFESYAREVLQKYFDNYPFIKSIKVFFRGSKHPSKKIKLHAHLKGKELFVEASGARHDLAMDAATQKLKVQIEKYKGKHFQKAS